MRESSLTSSQTLACTRTMPGCVIFKHFDSVTSGIPDLSITWACRTVWIEVKWSSPTYELRPAQKETMRKLGMAGLAYYVIFVANPMITIIRRSDLDEEHDVVLPGHNYAGVAEFVKGKILTA